MERERVRDNGGQGQEQRETWTGTEIGTQTDRDRDTYEQEHGTDGQEQGHIRTGTWHRRTVTGTDTDGRSRDTGVQGHRQTGTLIGVGIRTQTTLTDNL
jgi:hypothetical protein